MFAHSTKFIECPVGDQSGLAIEYINMNIIRIFGFQKVHSPVVEMETQIYKLQYKLATFILVVWEDRTSGVWKPSGRDIIEKHCPDSDFSEYMPVLMLSLDC